MEIACVVTQVVVMYHVHVPLYSSSTLTCSDTIDYITRIGNEITCANGYNTNAIRYPHMHVL